MNNMIGIFIGRREPDTYQYVSTTDTIDPTGSIDYIAIEAAINGRKVALTDEEKLFAARLLDSRGVGCASIGKLVGATPERIARWKAAGWVLAAPEGVAA
ncbi:hypothetical protein [Streptomyces sp. NPDC101249]|uniref:hypothetical protein n=1 Tax=Streptomyces sp. NPDC101249 TaxID=3366140 RepID=UPI00382CD317